MSSSSIQEDIIIPASIPQELSPIDSKTEELLNLIHTYETLVNDKYRTNFIEGYLNLSRANFSSSAGFDKRYGIDGIDLRPRDACVEVERKLGKFSVVNQLEEMNMKKKNDGEKVEDEKEIEGNGDGDIQIKKRKGKIDVKESAKEGVVEITDDAKEKKTYIDPILQFGGLVPHQLKLSQDHFKNAIEDSIEVLNLRKQIDTLFDEIEKLNVTD